MTFRRLGELALVAVLLWAALTWGQARLGAYEAEIGFGVFSGSDGPAHFVSGLMVREYMRHGRGRSPLAFARDYYDHYPKVAIGHWPPLFYLAEAAWLMAAPLTKPGLFALLAVIAVAPGVWLYGALRGREWSRLAAFAAALLLTQLPLMHAAAAEVTSELMTMGLVLGATLQLGRYLDSRKVSDGAWSGAWLGAALLTKGNPFALFLAPPLAAVLSRNARLLWSRGLWAGALVAVALAGPWYLYALSDVKGEVRPYVPVNWLYHWYWMGTRNAWDLARMCGPVLTVLAVAGLVRRWRGVSGRDVVLAAWLLAVWLFHSYVSPHQELRFAVYSAPALAWFGAQAAERWLGRGVKTAALLGAALAAAHLTMPGQRLETHGFVEAAAHLTSQPGGQVVLASGGSFAEGALIAETALREPDPRRRMVRTSKLLASSTWMGNQYRLLTPDVASVETALDNAGVDAVALFADARQPHDLLLREAVQRGAAWTVSLQTGSVTVYRRGSGSKASP